MCDELRDKSVRGSFTVPENMHLTLVFLGECDEEQTAAVKAVMNTITFEPFDITVDRIGRFKRSGGDVWWAGVQDSTELTELHNSLTGRLINAGLTLEKRKYSPHITLGRKVLTDVRPRHVIPFGEMVSIIDLMKSEHINGRQKYTSVYKCGKI